MNFIVFTKYSVMSSHHYPTLTALADKNVDKQLSIMAYDTDAFLRRLLWNYTWAKITTRKREELSIEVNYSKNMIASNGTVTRPISTSQLLSFTRTL